MIRISGLTFAYEKTPVLDHVDFAAGAGQLIAVLGKNGAGKSTLFKCMLGFLTKYEGTIELAGREIRTLSRRELARCAAYIPQSEMPVYNYTVEDTVLMGTTGQLSPFESPKDEQKKTAAAAIEMLGIEELSDRGILDLSGGERQLVLLARAIAQQAKILIMDEPTANLDYGNQHLVMRRIREMAENGYTVVLSTHNPEHALLYATHVLALKDHKIEACGRSEEIITEKLIEDLYGMRVKIAVTQSEGKKIRSCIPL